MSKNWPDSNAKCSPKKNLGEILGGISDGITRGILGGIAGEIQKEISIGIFKGIPGGITNRFLMKSSNEYQKDSLEKNSREK